MADIRIKDLATTAASTASDDFVAVDGSANGTRKLNAYSPTFGGNLTVSGTGNNILNSGGGNLLIGTTTNVAAYKLNVYGATSANVIAANGVTPDGTKTGGTFTTILGGTGASTGSYAGTGDIAGKFIFDAYGNNFIYEAGYIQSTITTGGNTDRNLHVAAMDFYTKPTASNVPTFVQRLTGTGNVLIGTTIDGGQKLQVNGTASFADAVTVGGTLTVNSNRIQVGKSGSGTGGNLRCVSDDGNTRWLVGLLGAAGATNFSIYDLVNSREPLAISAAGNTTIAGDLTVSSSGTSTFAGAIAIGNTVNTVSPTSPNRTITMVIGGVTYYLHAKTTND